MPDGAACLIVAAGLAVAAAFVAGMGGQRRWARVARAGIASRFFLRGAAGVSGNTYRLVSWNPSSLFVVHDRRAYGPLCLMIGVAAALGIPGPHRYASGGPFFARLTVNPVV